MRGRLNGKMSAQFRSTSFSNPAVFFLTSPPASGAMAASRAPCHTTPEARMQSTPPGQPSPFDDGELYDILLQGLDYGIDFYVGLARAAKGPVLDIACGTGRVLLPVLQAGTDADGMDLFQQIGRAHV